MAAEAEAVVDFTHPDVVMDNLAFCVEHGIHAVVGTTGLRRRAAGDAATSWLGGAPDVGVLVAPNFSIGAVLMMRFAAAAAPFYESVEIVELHHPDKADAPSGHRAAYRGADRGRAREAGQSAHAGRHVAPASTAPAAPTSTVSGSTACGCAGSSRTRRSSSAAPGETLTIRHDSLDRASFTPGVLTRAARDRRRPGLTVGLEHLLDLD